jgi:hypothetical protein
MDWIGLDWNAFDWIGRRSIGLYCISWGGGLVVGLALCVNIVSASSSRIMMTTLATSLSSLS